MCCLRMAPPWVRESRPSVFRRSRSRRMVISETPSRSLSAETRTLRCSASISRMRPCRSAGNISRLSGDDIELPRGCDVLSESLTIERVSAILRLEPVNVKCSGLCECVVVWESHTTTHSHSPEHLTFTGSSLRIALTRSIVSDSDNTSQPLGSSMSSPDRREMFPAERQGRILEILAEQRSVRVSALSDLLGVSEMTIRRDLERLKTEGLLSRTHGGAILKQHIVEEPRYVTNVCAHAQDKQRIAQATAAMIKPGETVFLGSGTTATQVLSHVDPDLHVRIITHNLGAVSSAQEKALDVILLGGLYRPRSNTLEGALSLEVLSGFHASKFILGADGVSLEEGITTASVGLAGVERAMLGRRHGPEVVLADRSKIGVVEGADDE